MGELGKFYFCHDSAIDFDLQEWETEAVDIDMGGLGKFYFDKKVLVSLLFKNRLPSDLS